MWANSNKKKKPQEILFLLWNNFLLYFVLWLWLHHLTFSSVPSLLYNCVTIFPLRHRAIMSMNISISEVHHWSNDISTATIFLSLNLFQVTS